MKPDTPRWPSRPIRFTKAPPAPLVTVVDTAGRAWTGLPALYVGLRDFPGTPPARSVPVWLIESPVPREQVREIEQPQRGNCAVQVCYCQHEPTHITHGKDAE